MTGLPHLEQLAALINSTYENGQSVTQRHALLFIEVIGLDHVNIEHGRSAGDEVLRHVVRYTRAGLRVADILFRNSSDEFVAFLGIADADTTDIVATRIRDAIARHPVDLPGGDKLAVLTSVTAVASPRDGASLQELLTVAKERSKSPTI